MSPYIEAGYAVVLGGLGTYAVILVSRERRAAQRLRASGALVPGRRGEAASRTDRSDPIAEGRDRDA